VDIYGNIYDIGCRNLPAHTTEFSICPASPPRPPSSCSRRDATDARSREPALGVVPNLFRLVANSPAALAGYLGLSGALSKAPAGANPRAHCIGGAQVNAATIPVAHVIWAERGQARRRGILANAGRSQDAKADAAVRFAVKVTRERGHIADTDLQAVRQAGYDDAQIIEIVQHVALNTWTN